MLKLHLWLLEAAETERRMPPALRQPSYGSWPDFNMEWLAYASVGTRVGLARATSGQISRYDKVLAWVAGLDDADDRQLLWGAAHTAAFRDRGPKWSKLAKLLSCSRPTVKRRYERALIKLWYVANAKKTT